MGTRDNSGIERREMARAAHHRRSSNEELLKFACIVSHELREPLRTIATYGQLLRNRTLNEPELADLSRNIIDAVGRTNALLDSLLSYSNAANGCPDLSHFISLDSVLQTAILNLSSAIADSGAEVTSEALPEVPADFIQITQVFQNLLGNAIKYRSAESPRIHVSARRENTHWIVSCRDNGVGIDPRYCDYVFGAFRRLHGRERPGTGMGLAICTKIIQYHGGHIWVDSDGGHGCNFHFALPADARMRETRACVKHSSALR